MQELGVATASHQNLVTPRPFSDYLKHREIKDQPGITQQSYPGVSFSRTSGSSPPLLFAPVYTRGIERRQSIKSRQENCLLERKQQLWLQRDRGHLKKGD